MSIPLIKLHVTVLDGCLGKRTWLRSCELFSMRFFCCSLLFSSEIFLSNFLACWFDFIFLAFSLAVKGSIGLGKAHFPRCIYIFSCHINCSNLGFGFKMFNWGENIWWEVDLCVDWFDLGCYDYEALSWVKGVVRILHVFWRSFQPFKSFELASKLLFMRL